MPGKREDRIREKAHEIWEREGRPHGEDQRHWHLAENEVAPDGEPVTSAKRRAKSGDAAPAAKPKAAPKASRAKKPM